MENLKKLLALYGFTEKDFADKVYIILVMAIKFHRPLMPTAEITQLFNQHDLIKLLNELIYYSQQFFFARQNERWELFIPLWIEKNKAELFELCLGTKLCEPASPTYQEYDAVAIFGANKSEIYRRYKFILELIKSKKITVKRNIYLLTGQRVLSPRVDGSDSYFEHLHQKFGDSLYETHIMIDLFERLQFVDYLPETVKIQIIDTPSLNNRRPNTYDTLVEMKNQLDPLDKSLLFISRSPAYWEQKAAVDRVFSESGLKYEVAGGSCTLTEVRDQARASYHVLMSLAGALYENYPVVAKIINDEQQLYTEKQLAEFKSSLGYRNAPNREVVFSSRPLTANVNKA